jgi:hypothetical protein
MHTARSLIPLLCLGGANLNCKKFCQGNVRLIEEEVRLMLSSYREIRVIEVRIIELKLRIKYCLSAIANKFVRVIETFELPKVRVMEVRL